MCPGGLARSMWDDLSSAELERGGWGGVESLQAGPSLHQATEILGLFWGVWEQTAFPCLLPSRSTRMFGAVTCCARGKQRCLVGIWAPSDIPQVGSRAVPASLSLRGLVQEG